MSGADTFRDALLKVVNAGHKSLITISGGRLGKTAANMPVVKLTTTGRVSGKPRTVMLTTPIQEDGRYVVVASKGGDDRHPDWYRNLEANPEVTLEPVGGDGAMTLIARTATPEEKSELWPRIATGDKGYAAYEKKTDREIPVVICELPTRKNAWNE